MAALELTDADFAQADNAIDFIRENLGAKREDLTDYLHNLLLAVQQKSITGRLAGITASAIPFYLREMGKLEERKAAATLPPSQHLGQVGDKITFEAMLLGCFPHESDFGVSYCTKMVTAKGEKLTWWASNDMTTEDPAEATAQGLLCKNVYVRVTGTVKKLDNFKGENQTTVSRCKVWTAEGIRLEDEKAAKKAARDAKKAQKLAANPTK